MYTRLLLALSLLSACEVTDSGNVISACTSICACEEVPLPAIQERCIAECSEEAVQASDECLACVASNTSCATLERDCEPLCSTPIPEPDEPF